MSSTNQFSAALRLAQPQQVVADIVTFLRQRWQQTALQTAVIAVSGGIDSALALTLLSQALPQEKIFPILLPYGKQDMTDAWTIIEHLQIPRLQCRLINIQSAVNALAESLQVPATDQLRLGNVMARLRMIALYDWAKLRQALVVGTENKSEHHLGYFTRFGDAASDIEPLIDLYKTQVRQLAEFLQLPAVFLQKAPSAGLWAEQSDEGELGFTYELADQVLLAAVERKMKAVEIKKTLSNYSPTDIDRVLEQVKKMAFKLELPYLRNSN